MSYKAIIFDLDGTLLDTLTDIAAAVNAVLAAHNWPTHRLDAYRYFVGDGMAELTRRALPENRREPGLVAACLAEVRADYAGRWPQNSGPYPGIVAMLEQLHARGFKLGVLSNKPDEFTRQMVARLLPLAVFEAVCGAVQPELIKPDPTKALELARIFGVTAAETVFVGDSAVDMQTGLRAGMYPLGVSWGFRPREELLAAGARHLIDAPAQLLEFLN